MDVNKPQSVEPQLPRPVGDNAGQQVNRPLNERGVESTPAASGEGIKRARHGRFYLTVFRPVCVYLLTKARSAFESAPPMTRLADRAIGYINGLSDSQEKSLQGWLNEAGPEERTSRQAAVDRISACVEKGHKHLELNGLDLTSLPEMIGEIRWLNVLECRGNQLTDLPDSIGRLSRLRELDCDQNQFRTLPPCICDPGLSRLNILLLSRNQLESLPDNMESLKRLEVLDCYKNKLTEFPPGILTNTNLANVFLGRNQISTLPTGLGEMQNLEQLNLAYNHFTEIPVALTDIVKADQVRCEVRINGNAFCYDDVAKWSESHPIDPTLKLLAPKRMGEKVAAKATLEQKIQSWFEVAGKLMPEGFSEPFHDDSVAEALNIHMYKLAQSKDYTSSLESARFMANKLLGLMEQMAADPDVMKACVAASVEANETCDDKAVHGLSEMDVATRVVKSLKEGGLTELVDLKKALYRKQLVEEMADVRYLDIVENGSRKKKPDQVEVRLAFLLGLQKELDLPIDGTLQMRYRGYSQVTDNDLKFALESVRESLLQEIRRCGNI